MGRVLGAKRSIKASLLASAGASAARDAREKAGAPVGPGYGDAVARRRSFLLRRRAPEGEPTLKRGRRSC